MARLVVLLVLASAMVRMVDRASMRRERDCNSSGSMATTARSPAKRGRPNRAAGRAETKVN